MKNNNFYFFGNNNFGKQNADKIYTDGKTVGIAYADGLALCQRKKSYAYGQYADGHTPTAAVGTSYADGQLACADGKKPSA